MKTKNVTASIPILKKLPDNGFSLNVGALTLTLGERNFILDSMETNFKNGQKKGSKFTFTTELAVDLETFEEDEEYNYNLTEKDLKSKELKAEFFCDDSDVGVDKGFDFEKAKISCAVTVDGKVYKINNVTFE